MEEELTSRIVTEDGVVIAEEQVGMVGNRFGQVIGELEVETKPAGIPERSLQEAQETIERMRAEIADLKRKLATFTKE